MTGKAFVLVALIIAMFALAMTPLASADRPIRLELVPPPDVSGQYCEDFMVRVHVTRFNEVATVFSNGETLNHGRLKQ